MKKNVWLKPGMHVARKEDMSPDGWLSVFKENDGDLIVTIFDSERGMCSAQFCTPIMGGGRSPKVRDALIQLALAIAEENKDTPHAAPDIDQSQDAFAEQR